MEVLPSSQAPRPKTTATESRNGSLTPHTSPLSLSSSRRIAILVALVILTLAIVGSFLTRGAMEYLPYLRQDNNGANGAAKSVVDQSAWKTAQTLSAMARSAEERQFAAQAQHLADHEVDLAFDQALRQANAEPRTLTGEALALQERVKILEATVRQDQSAVAALTPPAGTAAASAATTAPPNDDLEVAKAQLGLDQDQLTEAQQELAGKSNDPRTKIQQELSAREASMKAYDAQNSNGPAASAIVSTTRYNTLAGQLGAWAAQHTRRRLLEQARQQAQSDAQQLTAQRTSLLAQTGREASNASLAPGQAGSSRVRDLQHRAAQQSILGLLNERIAAQTQLAAIYAGWSTQVALQHSILLHLILLSLILIASIILLTVLAGWGLQIVSRNLVHEQRQRQTLQIVFNLGTELIGLLLVLLVVFGAPKQTPTILGLATAGLTVVFQDFILAFCGWFILMGKNGVRVGDWVEIDGVGGEVVSMGVFRTWLLETGNWTANGHPTGRRVSFLNGYAIKSKFFNFSTTGQWMWDEIKVSLPPGADNYGLIGKIREAVCKATENDASMAQEEWKRVTHEEGLPQFSATPTVAMRPAGAGVDIVVRYVTRAGVRLDTRDRIFRIVVELMLGPSPAGLPTEQNDSRRGDRQLA